MLTLVNGRELLVAQFTALTFATRVGERRLAQRNLVTQLIVFATHVRRRHSRAPLTTNKTPTSTGPIQSRAPRPEVEGLSKIAGP